ncbi:hypothetical protein BLOT_014546 [Blomia tropicalis]|nr:hypothetical protein BLOT_014546 [Blomia tropicalis]
MELTTRFKFLRAIILTVTMICMIILLVGVSILLTFILATDSFSELSNEVKALIKDFSVILFILFIFGFNVHFIGFMAAYKRNIILAYVYVAFIGLDSIADLIVLLCFIIDLEKLKKIQNDRALIIPTIYIHKIFHFQLITNIHRVKLKLIIGVQQLFVFEM